MARKVKWLAVGAVAVVAVGMTPFVSFAGDEPTTPAGSPAPAAAEDPAAAVPPAMADAIKRDLDLTDGELATRLDTEAAAPRIQDAMKAKLGDSYAGTWIPSSGDEVKVAITDPADAATVVAAGGEPQIVDRSAADLQKSKDKLTANARDAGSGVAGWYIDPESNALVIQAQPGKEAQARQFAKDSGAGPVTVEKALPKPELTGGSSTFSGGDGYINVGPNGKGSGLCSIGFAVTNGSDSGFLTAGHCGAAKDQVQSSDGSSLGTFIDRTVPSDKASPSGDFGWVKTNDNWTGQPSVNNYDGTQTNNVLVAGTTEVALGSSICHSGVGADPNSDNRYRCGILNWLNYVTPFGTGSDQVSITLNIALGVCSYSGDSGGAVMSGVQAQGITIANGGSCKDPGNAVTYYQLLAPVLNKYGLRLITTDPETVQTALKTSTPMCVTQATPTVILPGQLQLISCTSKLDSVQKWVFQPRNDADPNDDLDTGLVQLAQSSMCLTVPDSGNLMTVSACPLPTDKLSDAQTFTFNRTFNRLVQGTKGAIPVVSDASVRCLDIKGNSTASNTPLIIYPCKTQSTASPNNQTWSRSSIATAQK